jgi:hypothetical protein
LHIIVKKTATTIALKSTQGPFNVFNPRVIQHQGNFILPKTTVRLPIPVQMLAQPLQPLNIPAKPNIGPIQGQTLGQSVCPPTVPLPRPAQGPPPQPTGALSIRPANHLDYSMFKI